MKRKLLLLLCSVLTSVSMWAYTGSTPTADKTYFLYNVGANAYFVGTSGYYGSDGDITKATPIKLEASGSNYRLAFVYEGTTYRLYNDNGTRDCDNTTGVDFWFDGDVSGYKLQSKNNSNRTREMNSDGYFPKNNDSNKGHVTWQFISCDEVAEVNYVQSAKGWEKVTSVSSLKTNPENYFYAIFSANAAGLILDATTSNTETTKLYYKTANDPLSSSQYLFEMENYGSNLALKSASIEKYFANSSGNPWNYEATKTSMDADCEITVTLTSGVYTIQDKYKDGNNNYLGLWFPEHGYKNNEYLAGNKPDGNKGSFLIYRIAKDKLTSKIVNPTAAGNIDGWTSSGDDAKYNSGKGYDGVDGFFELCTWGAAWPSLSLSQTLYNLPNGYYRIKVAGQLSASETTMTLTANGESSTFTANGNTNGNILSDGTQTYIGGGVAGWRYNSVVARVTDGTLAIEVSGAATGIYCWGNFDNFTLSYIGSSLPESLTPVSGKMKADIATAQSEAVSAYNSSRTASNLNTALMAIKAAEISVAAYAPIKEIYDKYSVKAAVNMTSEGQESFNSSTAVTKYINGTYEDRETSSAVSDIENVYFTTLRTYPVVGADMTDFIENPSFETGDLKDGWTEDGMWIQGNKSFDRTDGDYYVECWHPEATGTVSVENTVTGLPSGFYRLTVAAYRDATSAKIYANIGGSETSTSVTTSNDYTVNVNYDGTSTFTIGYSAEMTEGTGWVCVDNFRLTYLGDASANLRVSDGKLGTFIAPFAITLPTGVKAYSATSDEEKVTLTKIAEGGEILAAGTPVIIYGDGVNVNETFYGDATVTTNQTVGALVGILNNGAKTVPEGAYVLQTQTIEDVETQAFYKLASDATGALNRCYVTASSGVIASRLAISIEDEVTAINAIEEANTDAEGLKDGKYLIEGKIVVVKNGVKYSVNGQKLN